MSLYSISLLSAWVLNILIGSFVYLKNRKSNINQSFFLLSLILTLWLIGCFGESISRDKIIALQWDRILYTGVSLYPLFYLNFLSKLQLKINKKLFKIVTLICLAFLLFNYVPFLRSYFIKSVEKEFAFRFIAVPGPFWFILVIFVVFASSYGAFVQYKFYKELQGRNRNQIKYLLIAYLILTMGGSMYFLLPLNIKVPPIDALLVVVFSVIVAYAIVRHQLMDVEVIIKKSLVFAGMFILAFGVFVVISLLVSQLIAGGSSILSFAISAFIIVIGLRPIEAFLINATDKFLFQKKYEYKEVLKKFIDEVITELNLDEVISSTLKLLDQTLHPYTASVFILNKVDDKYQLYNSYGLEDKEITFTSSSKLVSFLKKTHSPAVIKQINGIVGVNPEISFEMSTLKAILVLPLMLHEDLIGFIALGKKKSDEEYTKDDLDVLLDLARTESIAVGNAQLLREAAQAERRAAIGTMAAGINHEIGNPLNIMSTKIQLFKLARQKGLLQNKSNEEILNEAETTLDECLKQSGRISEITRKLANFAKPSKEFKPQVIIIPDEVDETLAVVGHDLELERIKIEKQFSPDLFKILADRQEIQQIFFNLIRNAGQAIEDTGTITISAVNTANNKVHIEIQDTGKGIAEDKINRIFEPFFTTKGPNKGTGLGLSIVRQLVWRNKGEISFKSQVGKSTTFILEFPKGE